MQALIVVDIQNDFLTGGALAVPDGDQVVPIANALMDRFPLVLATQDWHPPHHRSFAVEHGMEPGQNIQLRGLTQILWPVHCVQHSHGADFAEDLATKNIHKIFQKGCEETIDSYSGFFDNGKLKATGMGDFLREQGVKELTIAGLATDYCVKFTVLDALHLGFKTNLAVAGCRGVNLQPGDDEQAIQEMKDAGATVV